MNMNIYSCYICGKDGLDGSGFDSDFIKIYGELCEYAMSLERKQKTGPNYHYADDVNRPSFFRFCEECKKDLSFLKDSEKCSSDLYEKMRNYISNRKYNITFSTYSLLSYIDNIYNKTNVEKKTNQITKYRWQDVENKYDSKDFVYPNLPEHSHICATKHNNTLILIENRNPVLNLSDDVSKEKCESILETFKGLDTESMFAISTIPIENILSYQSTGYVEHTTVVSGGGGHGGGINKKGAVVGGLLFGGAGAVVGSQIGTEIFINPITSNIVEYDYRKTMLNLKNAEGQVKIKELPYYYAEVFQKVIPEKEFNFLQANKNIEVQVPVSNTNMLEEMKQLKELLDIGLITQEEFDSKRKQILKL